MAETLDILNGQFIVTNWMKDQFQNTDTHLIDWGLHPQAGVRLYTRAPSFADDSDLRRLRSITELDARDGWVPITGNLTSKSYRQEMGPLFYEVSTTPDTLTQTVTLVQQSMDGHNWPIALVEDGHGWEVSTGVQGIEQEPVVAAAMYVVGTYGGVKNPLLFITDQGLDGDLLLKGGSLYGMTKYAEDIPPSVLSHTLTIDNRREVVSFSHHTNVVTVTTVNPHHYSVGDEVRQVIWFVGTENLTPLSVLGVIDEHTFQMLDTESYELDTLAIADFTGAISWVERLNHALRPGTVLLDAPLPAYEPNNTAHTWLRPQRMNLLINPSIHATGPEDDAPIPGWKTGWTSTSDEPISLTPVPAQYSPPGVDSGVVFSHAGSGRLVLESNLFPVTDNNFMSVSVILFGGGIARVGVVGWDTSYKNPVYMRLPDQEVLNAKYGYDGPTIVGAVAVGPAVTISGLLPTIPGVVEYNLRIEWEADDEFFNPDHLPDVGPIFFFSSPIVDPSDGQYQYFDGDTNDGLLGDYGWMGGVLNQHKHFSVWYNNRKNTEARLFGGRDNGAYQPGLLTEWVPSSATVIPHWDAIEGTPVEGWTGDYVYPVKPVGTEVSHPVQEYNQNVTPAYPSALTDESGHLVRDNFGDPILIDYGVPSDDIYLTESGEPLLVEGGDYLLVA